MIKLIQCWDDGVVDDIRLCELLRKYHARASFNLNPAVHEPKRKFSWKFQNTKDVFCLAKDELLACYDGFTIANHSVTHPWPTKIPLEDWKTEVTDARKWLQDFFCQEVLGFAYPYGDSNPEVANVVSEAGHVYARACSNATPCFPPADAMQFAPDCHHNVVDFWERFERAKSMDAEVFYFWGHSYEFVTEEDWSVFEGKIARLSADTDTCWVDIPDLFTTSR